MGGINRVKWPVQQEGQAHRVCPTTRTVTARSHAAAVTYPRTLQRRSIMAAANESGAAADSNQPSACVIFLHGSGGCGEEWAEAMAGVQQQLPWVEFIFPTARARPYTLFGGEIANVWFDRNELGLVSAPPFRPLRRCHC